MSSGSVDEDLADSTQSHRSPAQGQPDMRRVLYRETHSSRAAAATVAAVLVLGLSGYGLLESALHAIGQPAWLIEPQLAAERIVALPAGIPPLLLGASGAVVAMVGLFFLLNAVLPGRRARHALHGIGISSAVVVDDEVIASALARSARLAANVTPEQVMVVVSQRQVMVNVRPTSGVPVAENAVLAAVQAELRGMSLVPMPEVNVTISTAGVIGA
ncbi:MAG TPA: hypothetical protein DIT15_00960 [Arthrobacter bacterium]|jgi:hypothetical protein|nr:hypothetical protein [Arthrobacter sp.]HAP91549.1 hypothetical protein [Arthrobacter sp.]HBH57454.1 hypothetical protein [Arthrobacter sp.]HCB58845.1 hypothetical protein [Arthrobacter sp.]HCC40197.1 hypothetical protein [Arthrobacter sp.]